MDFFYLERNEELTGKPLARFFRLLANDKKDIWYVYIYAIFNGLVNLTLPLGIQAIIGLIMGGMVSTSWVVLIIVVILGVAIAGGLQIMQLYITEILQQRIFTRSAFEFAYRIPRFKMESLSKYYAPELMNRFFDTLNVQKGLSKILIDFSSSLLQIIFGLVLLAFYHPFFVFFGIVLLLLLFVIFRFSGPRGLKESIIESKYKYAIAEWLEEMARTMGTFKLAGKTDLPLQKTDGLVSKYLIARKRHFKVLVFQYANVVGFKTLVTAGLLILGSLLVIEREINLGQFVAAEIIILIVINSVEKLILSMETIYDVLTGMEKLGDVTDLPIEDDEGISFEEIDTGKGIDIKVRDLSYSYNIDAGELLKNITFHVQPGERVCIAGFNNSGKTTLMNLISGLYTVQKGQIAYNNIPQGNIQLTTLRSRIGDILDQEQLFAGTIRENMCMGKASVPFEDVQWAARAIGVEDYIRSLPKGYNTQVLSEGKGLPKNVARKIIIARSIAAKPRLLVLEEFLHNLEREDRNQITEFLCDHVHNWTLIGISNDPIFAKKCDRIIILEAGKVLDEGTYSEIQQKPYFRNLFNVE